MEKGLDFVVWERAAELEVAEEGGGVGRRDRVKWEGVMGEKSA